MHLFPQFNVLNYLHFQWDYQAGLMHLFPQFNVLNYLHFQLDYFTFRVDGWWHWGLQQLLGKVSGMQDTFAANYFSFPVVNIGLQTNAGYISKIEKKLELSHRMFVCELYFCRCMELSLLSIVRCNIYRLSFALLSFLGQKTVRYFYQKLVKLRGDTFCNAWIFS